MKYLILLFIPLMLSADYAVKDDILNCPAHWVRYTGQWAQQHCEKKSAKVCIEVPLLFKCVYFSDINGTVQMDPTKKTSWDEAQATKVTALNNRNANRSLLRSLISTVKAGGNLTDAQRRKLDLLLIRQLKNETWVP